MKDLNQQLKELGRRNRDGSFAKQAARERILTLIANQLYEMGYRNLTVQSLKPKHVRALVERWQAEGLSEGTIKNRMAELRWWAEKIGKQNVIAAKNDCYGIEKRVYVTNVSKATTLTEDVLARIPDPYTCFSLRFQREFGLRRETSIKIRVAKADHGDRLVLQASWTKGGKECEVPISTAAQRALLDEVKAFAGRKSLIPSDKSYIQQLKRFEYQCGRAGIDHVHGLRHAYAQRRYLELTGWPCPAAGGLLSKELTPEQKALDRAARLTISKELGHEREQITAIYLGR